MLRPIRGFAIKTHMKINSHSDSEYEPKPLSNTKRFLSRTLILEGRNKMSNFKACKEHVSHLMIGNATGSLLKPAFIYESKIRNVLKQKNKNLLPVQIGWTSEQLAHVLNLAKQLKEISQKRDDGMDRWVQFCSKIGVVMNQYQLLYKLKLNWNLTCPLDWKVTYVVELWRVAYH